VRINVNQPTPEKPREPVMRGAFLDGIAVRPTNKLYDAPEPLNQSSVARTSAENVELSGILKQLPDPNPFSVNASDTLPLPAPVTIVNVFIT